MNTLDQNHSNLEDEVIYLIDIDALKQAIPGYTPEKANDFHYQSDKLARKLLEENLKLLKNKQWKVVFLSGGSATGKTEFLATFFDNPEIFYDDQTIIYDSTFSGTEGAKIKIKKVLKSGNIPEIFLILPDNFQTAFNAFHKRDRKIPEHRFYETHAHCRKTCLWVAENFPMVRIRIFISQLEKDDFRSPLVYNEQEFDSHNDLVTFLKESCITEEQIYKIIENENKR